MFVEIPDRNTVINVKDVKITILCDLFQASMVHSFGMFDEIPDRNIVNNVNKVKIENEWSATPKFPPCIDWSALDLSSPNCIWSRSHRIVIFASPCYEIEQAKSTSFAMFDEIPGLITVNSVNKVKNQKSSATTSLSAMNSDFMQLGYIDSKRFPSLWSSGLVHASKC